MSLEEADEEGRPIEMPSSRDQDRRPLEEAAMAVERQAAVDICQGQVVLKENAELAALSKDGILLLFQQ